MSTLRRVAGALGVLAFMLFGLVPTAEALGDWISDQMVHSIEETITPTSTTVASP